PLTAPLRSCPGILHPLFKVMAWRFGVCEVAGPAGGSLCAGARLTPNCPLRGVLSRFGVNRARSGALSVFCMFCSLTIWKKHNNEVLGSGTTFLRVALALIPRWEGASGGCGGSAVEDTKYGL